jgi:Kef-type K+ transport system membrane component KefB
MKPLKKKIKMKLEEIDYIFIISMIVGVILIFTYPLEFLGKGSFVEKLMYGFLLGQTVVGFVKLASVIIVVVAAKLLRLKVRITRRK